MVKEVFECKMCGVCCYGEGGILITPEELSRIANFLNLDEDEVTEKFLIKKGKRLYTREKNGVCVFFDRERGCTIHPVKPDICKAWPFLRGNMVDKLSFEMAKSYCAGIKPDADFEKFVKAGKEYLKENGLLNLSKPFLKIK